MLCVVQQTVNAPLFKHAIKLNSKDTVDYLNGILSAPKPADSSAPPSASAAAPVAATNPNTALRGAQKTVSAAPAAKRSIRLVVEKPSRVYGIVLGAELFEDEQLQRSTTYRLMKIGKTEKPKGERTEVILRKLRAKHPAECLFDYPLAAYEDRDSGETEVRTRKLVGWPVSKKHMKELGLPVTTEWVVTSLYRVEQIDKRVKALEKDKPWKCDTRFLYNLDGALKKAKKKNKASKEADAKEADAKDAKEADAKEADVEEDDAEEDDAEEDDATKDEANKDAATEVKKEPLPKFPRPDLQLFVKGPTGEVIKAGPDIENQKAVKITFDSSKKETDSDEE
jgi:hypothetical protein